MVDGYKNFDKMGDMLSENNEEARDFYKKSISMFNQERYDESLDFLDKAIEIAPGNSRLSSFRDSIYEMMEIKKTMNNLQKTKLELIKERERLKKIGIWKHSNS